MESSFRHQEVQVGEIWSFGEDLNVFVVEVREREEYIEDGMLWLRFNLLVLHVLSGEEAWKGKELTIREAANAGHGKGVWTLRRVNPPSFDSEQVTA